MTELPSSTPVEPSPILTSQPLGWDPLLVEEYQLPPAQVDMDGGSLGHSIALCLSPQPYRIHQAVGRRRYTGLYSKGDISITPLHVPASYRAEGDDHYLNIQLPTTFLETVAEQAAELDIRRLELITEFRTRDAQLEQTIMMLRSELHKGGGWVGQLYVESLANVLAVHLLRQYSAGRSHLIQEYSGGLGNRRLLQVSDYIQANLDSSIKLADLATVAGMSQYHFSRLFRCSTGRSPHQYVTQQRVERAKHLLVGSQRPLSEIALACGFNSQSHFGKSFRELVGTTPGRFRKQQ
ncbi:MAG: AraC family transcriptional regulator [Cyanobacteria bacterium J06606_4]